MPLDRRSFLSRAGLLAVFSPTLPRMLWELSDPYVIDPTGRRDSTRGLQRLFDQMPDGSTWNGQSGTYRIDGVVTIRRSNFGLDNFTINGPWRFDVS